MSVICHQHVNNPVDRSKPGTYLAARCPQCLALIDLEAEKRPFQGRVAAFYGAFAPRPGQIFAVKSGNNGLKAVNGDRLLYFKKVACPHF